MRSSTIHPQIVADPRQAPNDVKSSQPSNDLQAAARCLRVFGIVGAVVVVITCIIVIPIVLTSKRNQDAAQSVMNDTDSSNDTSTTSTTGTTGNTSAVSIQTATQPTTNTTSTAGPITNRTPMPTTNLTSTARPTTNPTPMQTTNTASTARLTTITTSALGSSTIATPTPNPNTNTTSTARPITNQTPNPNTNTTLTTGPMTNTTTPMRPAANTTTLSRNTITGHGSNATSTMTNNPKNGTESPRTVIMLNGENDTIVGLYNTTAGQSIGGFNGSYSSDDQLPCYAMDNSTLTSYLNYGHLGGMNKTVFGPGEGTGFLVIPSISNRTVAHALHFATANASSDRDPLTVTLEGSRSINLTELYWNSSWTLIYSGFTGINVTHPPARETYGAQQPLNNTQDYASYRLLITSQRGNLTDAVEYSEAQILGYICP